MAWKHGLHYLRDDHYHGQCVSCGAAPTPCHIEPGWPDCADLCADCKKGYEEAKLAEEDFDLYPEDMADAHGMGQESALNDVAEYLDLVAQELATTTDEELAASLVAGLASSLRDGSWHQHHADLSQKYPKKQSTDN